MTDRPELSPSTQVPTGSDQEGDEFSLLDFLIVLARHKRLILGLPFAAALAAAIVSLFMPNMYSASTKILSPQQNQSAAVAILGQLGSAGALAGNALGVRNPNETYVSMLKSRSAGEFVAKRFELQAHYEVKSISDAAQVLAKRSVISSARDGLITISVEDENPKRAADLANAYVDALGELMLHLAVGEASQRRLFFEKQHKLANTNLAKAQAQLQQFQERTGLVSEGLLGLSATTATNLRAQITAKEVQLTGMRAFATAQNPDLFRAEQELAALRGQLSRIEAQEGGKGSGVLVGLRGVPKTGIEYFQLVREVKYQETLYDLLSRQYEVAKIDEAKNASLIQVLDKAEVPKEKSKPNRRSMVIITALIAGIIAIVFAFVRESLARAWTIPRHKERLDVLRSYVWRR